MKSGEVTTNLHYLSDRRHALNIAMKSYKSFSTNDKVVAVDDDGVENIASTLQDEHKIPDRDVVIGWLTKNNPDLSNEIEDFSAILNKFKKTQENSEEVTSTRRFYGRENSIDDAECDVNKVVRSTKRSLSMESQDSALNHPTLVKKKRK
ncbi:uncharacterized protein LOC130613657 [Hydractinia symbiolongicarpus]|uniref:uncharacterized protein LOC130613657 n=1 Tax=Hydractinia symbiolongicarpus TaxID=13093 RepID=UPI00254AC546|nr:uncharacterized protein LOC130613657 [Hydractinia symbiolongicarpus]